MRLFASALAQHMGLTHMDRRATLQVRQREGGRTVAAVGGAE
jgi:hypothetical protein